MAWGGVCGALAPSLAALPLWPESPAAARAAQRVCERGARSGGAGAPGGTRRDPAGLGAGHTMPRPRTGGNTENEIALAS